MGGRLLSTEEATLPEAPAVGIAIRVVDFNPEQLHVAVLHAGEASVHILHLAWHRILSDEPLNPTEYYWLVINVRPERAVAAAALCRLIARRRFSVPYGVLHDPGSIFGPGGVLLLGSRAQGLTCATFVMTVLKSAGIQLLEEGQWPVRPEDAEWHARIVEALWGYRTQYPDRISEDHVRAVEREVPCARFRPEEVAAAGSFPRRPVAFDDAVLRAQQVRRELALG